MLCLPASPQVGGVGFHKTQVLIKTSSREGLESFHGVLRMLA
jgi:hypothetical protein